MQVTVVLLKRLQNLHYVLIRFHNDVGLELLPILQYISMILMNFISFAVPIKLSLLWKWQEGSVGNKLCSARSGLERYECEKQSIYS